MPIRSGVTSPRRRPQGFTLLEIMLVLVLIGLMLSTVVPTLRQGDESGGVQTLAETLLANSRRYRQQAMLTGQDMGLQLTEEGYQLVQYQDGRWQALSSEPEPVAKDIRLTFNAGESVWQEALLLEQQLNIQLADRLKVDTEPTTPEPPPAATEEPAQPIVPDIIFHAAGDVTPGRLALSSRRSSQGAQTLVFNENGQISRADEEDQ